MLSASERQAFIDVGHVTIPEVFSAEEVNVALRDIDAWSDEFLSDMAAAQAAWYLEPRGGERRVLRKLDNPAFHRPVFRKLAANRSVLSVVESIIGSGVTVFFSQVFCKPPEVGGPKPVHQDNFYFGPTDLDGTLTVWIALDDATTENGCLYYGDGTNRAPVLTHIAPDDQPFNLQIPERVAAEYPMTPAPVPSGGMSIHHGNTLHQSSANTSRNARRAVAFHYLRNDVELTHPALPYDMSIAVPLTTAIDQ